MVFNNEGDKKSCGSYRGIKLMSHTVTFWDRVVEAGVRAKVSICE